MLQTAQQFKKTRIAPTPSGYLHLGNVLAFAVTAALAERTGAKILLRIDDLDRERVNPLYVQDIFDTLNYLEISWHEGPRNYLDYEKEWSQVHRVPVYAAALQHLRDTDSVFACSCSRAQVRNINPDDSYPGTCLNKQLSFDTDHVSWRLKTDAKKLNVKILTGGIIKAQLPKTMRQFVVRRKNGYPAYQLSSVMDDVYFGVDLIVRGLDLWGSTLAQHFLAPSVRANAFTGITFYHHPLLMATGTAKLSKSAGAASVRYMRNEGKKPADIYTAIANLLGSNEPVKDKQGLLDLIYPY